MTISPIVIIVPLVVPPILFLPEKIIFFHSFTSATSHPIYQSAMEL
jgi:hypothetical protein